MLSSCLSRRAGPRDSRAELGLMVGMGGVSEVRTVQDGPNALPAGREFGRVVSEHSSPTLLAETRTHCLRFVFFVRRCTTL